MTLSTTLTENSHAGDGSTTDFAVGNIRFFADADLQVELIDDATGARTMQTLNTDYTVTGTPDASGGFLNGTVAFTTAPAAGKTIYIKRVTAIVQGADYVDGQGFPADTHEANMDKLAAAMQEAQRDVAKATIFPPEESGYTNLLPALAVRKGKAAGYDANGDPAVASSTLAELDAVAALANIDPPGASNKHKALTGKEDGTGLVYQEYPFWVAGAAARDAIQSPYDGMLVWVDGTPPRLYRWDSATWILADGFPVNATDEALARFDGVTGKIQNSPNGPFANESGQLYSKAASGGAYIGGFSASFNNPPNNDLNDADSTGWYGAFSGVANRPTGSLDWLVLNVGISSGTRKQIAFRTAETDLVYVRNCNGAAVWGAWTQILTVKTLASESAAGAVEVASTAEARSNATGAKALTAAKRKDMAAWVAISDAATIALDLDTFVNGKVDGVAGNRTIGNPTNGGDGLEYTLWLIGDSATARTISFGSNFKGDLPTITDLTSTKQYLLIIKRMSSTHFTVSAKVVAS